MISAPKKPRRLQKNQVSVTEPILSRSSSLNRNKKTSEFLALNLLEKVLNSESSNSGPSLAAFQTRQYSKDNL